MPNAKLEWVCSRSAEKTAATSEMNELAQKRGLKLGVISQRRFEPHHQAVKSVVDSGVLGKLPLVELVVTGEEGKQAVQLIEAIHLSSAEGREVKIVSL